MKLIKLFIILYLLVSNSLSFMRKKYKHKRKSKGIISDVTDLIVGTALKAWSGERAVFCWKLTHTRGIGTIPKHCDKDQEMDTGLCYNKCNKGYYPVGPVCWADCKKGYEDQGATCYKDLFDFYFKETYGRGIGTIPAICEENEEYNLGLCYSKCKPGYYGVGPVCWKSCQGEASVDCGTACASNIATCTSNIFGMLKSLFDVFLNISETILTLGSIHIIKNSIQLSVKATFTAAQMLAKEGASKEAIKKTITDSASAYGGKLGEQMLNMIVDNAYDNLEFDWKDFANFDPTGITSAVMGFIKTGCE